MRGVKTKPEFKAFFNSYVETALWSSTDNADDSGGEPLDKNYGVDDIAPSALRSMRKDCLAFFTAEREDLKEYAHESKFGWGGAGHDFWLTRNGHGAGFWDRGLGALGDRLSKACKPYGSSDLYVGDDGKIYVS